MNKISMAYYESMQDVLGKGNEYLIFTGKETRTVKYDKIFNMIVEFKSYGMDVVYSMHEKFIKRDIFLKALAEYLKTVKQEKKDNNQSNQEQQIK
jgi:uncharacterized NAD-dependent epimerase/dehydratase family protein